MYYARKRFTTFAEIGRKCYGFSVRNTNKYKICKFCQRIFFVFNPISKPKLAILLLRKWRFSLKGEWPVDEPRSVLLIWFFFYLPKVPKYTDIKIAIKLVDKPSASPRRPTFRTMRIKWRRHEFSKKVGVYVPPGKLLISELRKTISCILTRVVVACTCSNWPNFFQCFTYLLRTFLLNISLDQEISQVWS